MLQPSTVLFHIHPHGGHARHNFVGPKKTGGPPTPPRPTPPHPTPPHPPPSRWVVLAEQRSKTPAQGRQHLGPAAAPRREAAGGPESGDRVTGGARGGDPISFLAVSHDTNPQKGDP